MCSDTGGVTIFTKLLVQERWRWEQQYQILLQNNVVVVFITT